MSGRLVSAVLASGLPGWLKLYAVGLADFGADDGSRIFPSVARLARHVSRSERQTQAAIRALRRLGVLEVVTPPGRYRTTHYRLCVAALPPARRMAEAAEQLPLFEAKADEDGPAAPISTRRPADMGRIARFPQASTAINRKRPVVMGAAGSTRSVR